MIKILLDTDTAGDDTTAMLLAMKSSRATLEAVTINCGNVSFDQEVENALYTIEVGGKSGKIPVYPGARHPLLRDWETAERVHGDDGMGNSRFPKAKQRPETKNAVDAILELVNSEPGEITLVEIAPMTNLALAIRKDPSISKKVKHLYFMGGTNQYLGNVTPAAEFNIWVDPDAAAKVLASGMKITIVPLDVTHRVLSTAARVARLDRLGNRCAPYAARLIRAFDRPRVARYGRRGRALHDPSAVAYLIAPELFRGREVSVMVETESELARGMTIVDWWGVTGRPANARFLDRVDAGGVYDLLVEALARLP